MASKLTAELLRYTQLPSLLHILKAKAVTLLDPDSWEDRNDASYMALYKERQSLKSFHALCFSQVPETYHHWHVFAHGSAGACVYFRRDQFLVEAVSAGAQWREVSYLTIKEARAFSMRVQDLPYLKRAGYRPEGELRVVHEDPDRERPSFDIPIAMNTISKVSLSPWLPKPLADSVKAAIRAIDGCDGLKVTRSTLISNSEWQELGREAT